jgi:hypothetical protein
MLSKKLLEETLEKELADASVAADAVHAATIAAANAAVNTGNERLEHRLRFFEALEFFTLREKQIALARVRRIKWVSRSGSRVRWTAFAV